MMPLPKIYKLENDLYTGFKESLDELNVGKKFITVCGTTYTKKIAYEFIENTKGYEFFPPIEVYKPTVSAAFKIRDIALKENAPIIGFGGGKIMDVAKLGGSDAKKPVILVPTQPTHDAMASPVVSIAAPVKHHSVPVDPPTGVILPMPILYNSSKESIVYGTGDSIAKITANLDWKLSAELNLEKQKDPKYDEAISSLCLNPSLENLKKLKKMKESGEPFLENEKMKKSYISDLVDALIRYGKSMCTINSSVCASGSEHLWAHALDLIPQKSIPHGIGAGSGTIIAYGLYECFKPNYLKKLHTTLEDLKDIANYINLPYTSRELGIKKKEAIFALIKAVQIGDERGRVTIYDYIRFYDLNEGKITFPREVRKITPYFAKKLLNNLRVI